MMTEQTIKAISSNQRTIPKLKPTSQDQTEQHHMQEQTVGTSPPVHRLAFDWVER